MLFSSENNHNPECGLAIETAAYLYGEMSEMQAAEFENHLGDCVFCRAELSNFSSIRSAIGDWKKNEFDNLELPPIALPAAKDASAAQTVKSRKWFFDLEAALASLWVKAGAFAVLAVFAGLVFISVERNTTKDVANLNNISPVSDENTKGSIPKPESTDASLAQTNPETQTASTDEPEAEIDEVRIAREKPKKQVGKSPKTNKRQTEYRKPKEKVPGTVKSAPPEQLQAIAPQNSQRAPKLNTLPEINENEDLRLIDLLDELDSK